jgi:hypothetical protein
MHESQLDSQLISTPEIDPEATLETRNYSPGTYDFSEFYHNALDDLPLERFQNELKMKGVCPGRSLFVLVKNCADHLGLDLRSLQPKSSTIQIFGASEFARPFLRDIASCMASTTRPGERVRYFEPTLSLPAFQSLLPKEVSRKQYQTSLNVTAKSLLLES